MNSKHGKILHLFNLFLIYIAFVNLFVPACDEISDISVMLNNLDKAIAISVTLMSSLSQGGGGGGRTYFAYS